MKRLSLAVLFATSFAFTPVQAQMTIDVAKITCDQYLSFSVADPRDIAIWLSGYFHGKGGSTVLAVEELKQHAAKLQSACFRKDNSQLTVMQVIEKGLDQGK